MFDNELASRWLRLAGAVLDGIIMMIIQLPVIFLVMGGLEQLSQGGGLTLGQTVGFFLFHLVVFAAVNGWLLFKRGQTVGKMVAGTRIVDLSGNLRPFSIVFFVRYALVGAVANIPIAGGLFSLIDVLFIFRNDKRCIHDLLAGTKVVRA